MSTSMQDDFHVVHDPVRETANRRSAEAVDPSQLGSESRAEIYLAAGCFWGAEGYFQRVPGILDTDVGYANGKTEDTSYREVADTGHAETVKLVYDPHKIHLAEILERYLRIIDPFSLNRQGNDRGNQYRTGIYYTDEASGKLARYSLAIYAEREGEQPVVECQPLENFILAEDYHQDYLVKNPGGYCHINLATADDALFPGTQLAGDDELKQILSEVAYRVTRERGTERAHTSPLDQNFSAGIYVDVATGQPLFSSLDKYDAGCGWPSFTMPITTDALTYSRDDRLALERTEVTGGSGNHLGHVFEDGLPDRGSLRYCINGAALRFIALDDMDKAGYTALKPFVYEP